MDNNNLFDDLDFLNSSAQDLFAPKSQAKPSAQAGQPAQQAATKPAGQVQNNVAKNNAVQNAAIKTNTSQTTVAKNSPVQTTQNVQQNVAVQNSIKTQQNQINQQIAQNKKLATQEQEVASQAPKRKMSKKKKRVIAFLIIFVLLLAGGGAMGIMYYQDISQKLETPTFTYYQLHTGTIIETSLNQKADKYEFIITQPGREDISIVAKSNRLELGSYLNQPGQYGIKVRCLGKVAKAHSEYSQQQIVTNYKKLATPTIHKNADDTISWDAVANASKYWVYFGANELSEDMRYIEIAAYSGMDVVTFNLAQIYENGEGVYPITVVAKARSGGFYLDSDLSNKVDVKHFEQMQTPIEATYYNSSKTLQIAAASNIRIPEQYKVEITYDNPERTTAVHYVVTTDLNYEGKTVQGIWCYVYTANFNEFATDNVLSINITALAPDGYSTDSQVLAGNVQ
ncbi:MAG: hypothetical protein E7378_02385 [Clostridiales bacterium]|nr:hypothetical protein [Clostridiales bacterium]